MFLPNSKLKAIKRAARFFRNIPFVDLAVLSGSCATGKARAESDIDVIVGARSGRVWTARFFTLLFADIFGMRNKGAVSRDKLCLSHFASPECFCLREPVNEYEREPYPYLKPIFGSGNVIARFFSENREVLNEGFVLNKDFWIGDKKSGPARVAEWVFSGCLGNIFERTIRHLQSDKIKKYARKALAEGKKVHLAFSDDRVETHFWDDYKIDA